MSFPFHIISIAREPPNVNVQNAQISGSDCLKVCAICPLTKVRGLWYNKISAQGDRPRAAAFCQDFIFICGFCFGILK